jgi:hypothetical protein
MELSALPMNHRTVGERPGAGTRRYQRATGLDIYRRKLYLQLSLQLADRFHGEEDYFNVGKK